jgi:hypothetical protein
MTSERGNLTESDLSIQGIISRCVEYIIRIFLLSAQGVPQYHSSDREHISAPGSLHRRLSERQATKTAEEIGKCPSSPSERAGHQHVFHTIVMEVVEQSVR